MSTLRTFIAASALITTTGCTWVSLTDNGAGVDIVDAEKITTCELLGEVTSSTQDKIVVGRNSGKVQEELFVLARNEAARLSGDTIVAMGPPRDGAQDFTAYRCR
ncbi:MAG: DUF4156 domain-containing protein [Pseudomonadales bacterium]